MPRLSRWAVRAALLYLVLGFSLGALLLTARVLPLPPSLWSLLPVHIEFLVIGWAAQLALGVAFWILPRFGGGRGRGNEGPAWAAVLLLNLGLALDTAARAGGPSTALFLAGRLAQAAAGLTFAWHAWDRIRSTRS